MNRQQALLHKYLNQKCSREELLLLFTYLKEEREADHQAVMDAIWEELSSYEPIQASTSREMYANIRTQMDESTQSKSLSLLQRLTTRPSLRVAAAFAVLLLSVFVFYLLAENDNQVVHQTDYGQTTTVQLPDHSVITLNGNTRVSYAPAWADSTDRELWIEGEAYFSIRHTEHDQKFIVHANQLEIEVLGTEFNVNNRDGNTWVTLSTGKIKLNGPENLKVVKDVILRPGEQAELTHNRAFEVKVVNTRLYTAWKDQELVFDHTPMAEVVRMIESTYGLEVVIRHDDINRLELTGLLPSNDIDMLLNMLSDIFNLEVTRKDHQVFIDRP